MRATFNSRYGFLAAVVVAAFVADAGRVTAAEPKSYQVLAVGVSQYKSISSAGGSDHDAERVGDVLKGRKLTDKPQTLTNKDATTAAVKAALRDVKDRVKPGEAAVLFFAGHGSRANKGKEWVFLPYDFDEKNAAETMVWNDELLSAADALAARGHDVLLAVDACFSGMLITRAEELGMVGAKRAKKAGRGALVIATSCRAGQLSSATREEAGQFAGWFTAAFADALGGKADADRDGVVSVSELRAHLEARLYVITHKQDKEPGLAWPAQDSLVAGSPEAGEGFGVVRGDKKAGRTAGQVRDEDFVPGGPDILSPARPAAAPVGTWAITKCEVVSLTADPSKNVQQKGLRGEYTLTLRADGTYTARLKLSKDRTEVTAGTYTYAVGGSFVLTFPGGQDELHYSGGGEKDWMKVRLQSAGSRWGSDTYYELERVKD